MVCTETILGKIVEKIVETVFQSVGRHVGFLLHYKQNMKNLEDEVNINLQEQRTNVEGKINEANRCGEAIDNDVSVWLKNADETRQGVDKFMDDKAVKENMLCFNFSFPNFISRYNLSKEAEKEVVRVKHLTEKGGNIGTVSHPREDPPEVVFRSSGNYECFHSRDKVFKDIVKALQDPEVNMIGVYGSGGVGKTTMVTKVAEQVKKDETFDEVVIAVVSQDANVKKIQEQLAARLKLPLSEETDDEVGRASRLWNRLDNGMKNLIILDDVWHELDLKEIGIPLTGRNRSCKVVLTSRNRDMWKNMAVHKIEVIKIEILSEQESWDLFKKKVGNYVDAHELREIARAVCKECKGLPVAINAIGAALKGKDMYAWRDALDKLKNSMLKNIEGIDQKVYASLKWSYDQLDSEDAKSCFLLCCLFPEDARIPIDDLVRYYMAGRTFHLDQKPDSLERALDRVRTVVSTLISCCLLLDENYDKDVVKMHDVVRDIAISIAKGEKYSFLVKHGVKDWPEKATYEQCSVISLRPRDMREFPDELVCLALNTLRLDCTNEVSWLQVPDRFFSGTENLMVLDLKSVTMSPILPASLAKLAKLQMLCLDGCKLGDIAIVKDLKDHLEILSLRRSDIEVLPLELGELTRLRVLDMEDCDKLKVIPKGIISKLFRLEELYMPRTFRQWEGTRADGTGRDISCVSVDELMSLIRLTTLLHVCIQDPALLPKDFTFENLVRFDIAVGEMAYHYYSKDSTGFLQLENIHLANPVEGLLGKPNWCRQRNGLYPSTSFYHLANLGVTDCSRLKYLFSPSSARGLVQLKKLAIERCMNMEGVIGNEGEEDHEDIIPISFSRLTYLELKSLPNLKSFYPKKKKKATSSESCSANDAQTVLFTDKVAFPALERFEIDSVPEITKIWYKQVFPIPEKETESSFCHLDYMRIAGCGKLMNVVGGCPKIEATVAEKQKGKEADHYVTRFPKLMTLELSNLLNLETFCSRSIQCEAQPLFDHQSLRRLDRLLRRRVREEHIDYVEIRALPDRELMKKNSFFVAFPALERLEVDSVPVITKIWDKQVFPIPEKETESSFSHLEYMRIAVCSKLMNVVGGCPKIEATVMEKRKGKEVDQYVTSFPKLKTLELSSLLNLERFCSCSIQGEAQPLFDHQVALPALKRLVIEYVPEITEIWDKQIFLIPEIETESSLHHLDYMSIAGCGKLMNVVGGCLKIEAIVTEKQKAKEIDHYVTRFPKLTTLELQNLLSLESFCSRSIQCEAQPLFDHQVALPALQTLMIDSTPKITEIWDKQILLIPEKETETFFCHLEYMRIVDCCKLMNVVGSCPKIEAIVTEKQKGKEVDHYVTRFPKLSTLILQNLQCLESFCSHSIQCEAQSLFDHQVAFPKLESLRLEKLGGIVIQQLLGACESSIKTLVFSHCDELSTVVSPRLFRRLLNVDLLLVESCNGVTEVGEGQECVGSLIQVRKIDLHTLPKLTCLWNKDPHGHLCLQNLEYLNIWNCPLLQNLCTASVAKALCGLKVLNLMSCSTMEEVIATEEGREDVIDDEEIVFPKLEWLILKELSNLKSFCNANYNFNLPSLKKVVVKRCPNMQTFTSGSVRMPPTLFITRQNDGPVIEDLNKHLQQQHSKGDQETIESNELYGEEDQLIMYVAEDPFLMYGEDIYLYSP